MQATAVHLVGQVVDTERYPLADPGSPSWITAVDRARNELRAVGCTVLRGFVRPSAVERLRRECASVAPLAHRDVATVNVYNTEPDPSLPPGHPARTTMERGNAFVSREDIRRDLIVHRLYRSPAFQRFVASCVELPRVHELADPLSGLCLNVLAPGRDHPWHFDTNELSVTMLTQEPDSGGELEYCPNIRTAQTESLDDVAAVLAGRGDRLVRRIAARPGDLQLFRGRYSLHRVRPVRGAAERHSAIFAYSERPGVIGSVARTRQLFGRVSPEHLAAEGRAVRVDRLLD